MAPTGLRARLVRPSEGFTDKFDIAWECVAAVHCDGTYTGATLPAGSYWISVKGEVYIPPATSTVQTVTCTLSAGEDSDAGAATVARQPSENVSITSAMLSLDLMHTFTEPGTPTLDCGDTAGQTPGTRNFRMSGVRLGRIRLND